MFHFMSSMKEISCFNFLSKLMVACLVYSLAFGQCSLSYAQANVNLPAPGSMVGASAAYVPVLLKGMTLHPEDPFRFDFIVDNGNSRLAGQALQKESKKLVNYFLTAMTVPGNDLWVNLSPVEKDRVIPDALNRTELGYGLLAQDYILKQLTASLIYPESDLGKKFWERVYQKVQEKFGTADIPTDTFNKVWIMPEAATVYERGASVYIVDAKLKVMLDTDHDALLTRGHVPQNVSPSTLPSDQPLNVQASQGNTVRDALTKDILREVILPEIEKEVNSGENFAPLRQIYYSLIFAKWYKEKVRNSILSQVYIDQNKVKGVDVNDPAHKEQVYARYMEAYKKGVYNYVKEELDVQTQEVTSRKYFSGGFQDAAMAFNLTDSAQDVNDSLVGNNFKLNVKIDAQKSAPGKKDLLRGYVRNFGLRYKPTWRGVMVAAAMTFTMLLGFSFVGCSKTPTGVEWTQEEIDQKIPEYLRQLTMDDTGGLVYSDAYPRILEMAANGDISPAVVAFAKDSREAVNPRRWAIYFVPMDNHDQDFEFLMDVALDTTGLYVPIHKEQAASSIELWINGNHDKYMSFVDRLTANPGEAEADGLLSLIYEIGKEQSSLLRALPLALGQTTGVVHQKINDMITQIVNETLTYQYSWNGMYTISTLEALGEIITDRIISFCQDTQNNTDHRKYAMRDLGYVGEYTRSFNYLKSVVESVDGTGYDYFWWHRIEAENGLVTLIMRQSNVDAIVDGLVQGVNMSSQMQRVGYHILFHMNTAVSIQRLLDGLSNNPDPYVRASIAWILADYYHQDIGPGIISDNKDLFFQRLSNDPSVDVRRALVYALFRIVDQSDVFGRMVTQLRDHPQADARVRIAEQFGYMGADAVGAIPTLEYVRDHDTNADVVAMAIWAIDQITGSGNGLQNPAGKGAGINNKDIFGMPSYQQRAQDRSKIIQKALPQKKNWRPRSNIDKAQGQEKVDLAVGYSKDFAQYPVSLWRAGVKALMMLVIIGFISMVPAGCSKSPTRPDIEIPSDPQEINKIVVDNLRLLTMGDPFQMQDTDAYHTIIGLGSAATDALMAFARNADEADMPRNWAVYILGLIGTGNTARDFFIQGFDNGPNIPQAQLVNGFAEFVSRNALYTFCLNSLSNVDYSDHVKAQIMAAVCQIANWYGQTDQRALQMLLQALPVAEGEALWEIVWYMPRVSQGITPVLAIFNNMELDPGILSGAANFLGRVEDAGTVDVRMNALTTALLDRVNRPSDVRQWSASSLGDLGDVRAIPALENAQANDPEEIVRLTAGWAIDQINGGGKMAPPGGNAPADYQGKAVQTQVDIDKAQAKDLGGIDMNDIRIRDKANGLGVEFDARALDVILNMKVDGFAPVIIELTPVKDVVPLLI